MGKNKISFEKYPLKGVLNKLGSVNRRTGRILLPLSLLPEAPIEQMQGQIYAGSAEGRPAVLILLSQKQKEGMQM